MDGKDHDLSLAAGNDNKAALSYDEAEALAKAAANAAMAGKSLYEGLPLYMNTLHKVMKQHGHDLIYEDDGWSD